MCFCKSKLECNGKIMGLGQDEVKAAREGLAVAKAEPAGEPAGRAKARSITPCSRAETKSTNWKFS